MSAFAETEHLTLPDQTMAVDVTPKRQSGGIAKKQVKYKDESKAAYRTITNNPNAIPMFTIPVPYPSTSPKSHHYPPITRITPRSKIFESEVSRSRAQSLKTPDGAGTPSSSLPTTPLSIPNWVVSAGSGILACLEHDHCEVAIKARQSSVSSGSGGSDGKGEPREGRSEGREVEQRRNSLPGEAKEGHVYNEVIENKKQLRSRSNSSTQPHRRVSYDDRKEITTSNVKRRRYSDGSHFIGVDTGHHGTNGRYVH